jgi:hypothetical protein
MALPFTHDQFLAVFGDYNRALWPVAALLWLATAVAVFRLFRPGSNGSRLVAAVLTVQWAWAGVVYHLVFFRRINPAATLFGLGFLLQAMLLLWRGTLRHRLVFVPGRSVRARLGLGLVVYALVYPGVGLLLGLQYPRLPTFGVPCPSTILTAGLLLLAPRHEARILGVIPLGWAGVAGSAALVLGIRADLVLVLAGILLAAYILSPAPGGRPAAGEAVRPV